MSTLRHAAQQALEALRNSKPNPAIDDEEDGERAWYDHYAAIKALREALVEQPAEQGSLVQIRTPLCFADGDHVTVYVQSFDNNVHRFFDDGQTVLHFSGRGMKFESGQKLKFLSNIAKKHGVGVNDNGVIEIFTNGSEMADAFAKYITCLASIAHWEAEHQWLDVDGSAFATEVANGITGEQK